MHPALAMAAAEKGVGLVKLVITSLLIIIIIITIRGAISDFTNSGLLTQITTLISFSLVGGGFIMAYRAISKKNEPYIMQYEDDAFNSQYDYDYA